GRVKHDERQVKEGGGVDLFDHFHHPPRHTRTIEHHADPQRPIEGGRPPRVLCFVLQGRRGAVRGRHATPATGDATAGEWSTNRRCHISSMRSCHSRKPWSRVPAMCSPTMREIVEGTK